MESGDRSRAVTKEPFSGRKVKNDWRDACPKLGGFCAATVAEPLVSNCGLCYGAAMAEPLASASPTRSRPRLIAACGVIIILLSAGAALLPVVGGGASAAIVGSLLAAAGLVEVWAGTLHRQAKGESTLAGVVTILAGVLFIFNPVGHFGPTALIVTGWLVIRSLILFLAGRHSSGSVRMWTFLSAAMDLALAVVLFMGISISSLVVSLFGPTEPVVAGFAWIFALSFVVTGAMLLEIASCERELTGNEA
jgi:uncharacterized membrane protein HdeD (DUF308 family)